MKISISYPPILNDAGQKAMVSQNRNVQFFKKPTYLLPVIQAQAATKLKKNGFDVVWDDGNAEQKSFDDWLKNLIKMEPDIVLLEGTTPVMKFLWDLSFKIKDSLPHTILIICGYHAMRQPQETLLNSKFDIVLKSTNLDFVLLELCIEIQSNNLNYNFLKTRGVTFRKHPELMPLALLEIACLVNVLFVDIMDQIYLFQKCQ